MLKRVNGPAWKGSWCVLPTRHSASGKQVYGSLHLDLKAFSRLQGSFLRLAIDSQSYPLHRAVGNKFQRALQEISGDPTAVEILNSAPDLLTAADIGRLFSVIEGKVATWGKVSRYTMAQHALKVLREMPERLGDGTTASESGFSTRFEMPTRSAKAHAAERPLRKPASPIEGGGHAEVAEPPPLIDAIQFHSLAERDSKAYGAGTRRQEEIAELCLKCFAQHDELVQRLKAAKAAGVPQLNSRQTGIGNGGLMDPNVLLRLPEGDQLQVILHVMEREKFHIASPTLCGHLPLEGLKFLERYLPDGLHVSHGLRRELLLSDYYLPAHVIAACVVALQNDKLLNTEVIFSLTSGDVEKSKKGYRFTGVKGKTGQIQSREVNLPDPAAPPKALHFTNQAAVRALDLLLAHAQTIEHFQKRSFVPLVSCLHQKFPKGPKLVFIRKSAWHLIQVFCGHNNINRFDTRYLRHLALQTHVLSPEGTPYSA